MIKVLCFRCGVSFEVAEGTKNVTKHCPTCKDKLENEMIQLMFGDL